MNISEKIMDFVKSKNEKKQIQNLRGLVKSGENEWTFMYTFIEGDYLSISKLFNVHINSESGKISYVRTKKTHKKKIGELVTV
jgi:hypothetical protein